MSVAETFALLIVTLPSTTLILIEDPFNGDGFSDLAIGVPFENAGTLGDAGAVNVLYGSAAGLTAIANQFWSQDSPGILGSAGARDHFGESLAVGDFNSDGFADLAVGAPGERVGTVESAGAVNVLYGSATGLTATGDQIWSQNSPGVVDGGEAGDNFGFSLAAGDFDSDGFADLAVGVPIESDARGAVNVLYGTSASLSATDNQIWSQNSPGVLDTAERDDFFGSSLTVGDFNGDGFADLAAAAHYEGTATVALGGGVAVLYGGAAGLSATGNQFWSQDSVGILDAVEESDGFGWYIR